MRELTCLEICAGAGGQSLGLEQAGYSHVAAVELDPDACATLRLNRPQWKVEEKDVRDFDGRELQDVLGYRADWQVLNACDFGVPQLRPRFILVAMRPDAYARFEWPAVTGTPLTVGEALHAMMGADGWTGADEWARKASGVGPTLVGGSRKHGGPDLGPTRARQAWRKLGVDGGSHPGGFRWTGGFTAGRRPRTDRSATHSPRRSRGRSAPASAWQRHDRRTGSRCLRRHLDSGRMG